MCSHIRSSKFILKCCETWNWALSDHWYSIHEWSCSLCLSTPMNGYILIRNTIFNVDYYNIVYTYLWSLQQRYCNLNCVWIAIIRIHGWWVRHKWFTCIAGPGIWRFTVSNLLLVGKLNSSSKQYSDWFVQVLL